MRRSFAVFLASLIIMSCSADNDAQLVVKANATSNIFHQSIFQSKNFDSSIGFDEKDINQPDGYSFLNNPTENTVFKKYTAFL